MVAQNFLQQLLRWLVVVLRNLLESTVGRCEQSEVGLSTVECLDDVWVLVNPLG